MQHPELGALFLCGIVDSNGRLVLEPRDSYRQRAYLEPLGLYMQADAGLFKSIALDMDARSIEIEFEDANATFTARRLRLNKEGLTRPGQNFRASRPSSVSVARGAFEIPVAVTKVVVECDADSLTFVYQGTFPGAARGGHSAPPVLSPLSPPYLPALSLPPPQGDFLWMFVDLLRFAGFHYAALVFLPLSHLLVFFVNFLGRFLIENYPLERSD